MNRSSTALVTGATSDLGFAMAKAASGRRRFGIVNGSLRKQAVRKLSNNCSSRENVHSMAMDVRDESLVTLEYTFAFYL